MTSYEGLYDRLLGATIGGIVGDAFGSPYEFTKRDTYKCTKDMENNSNFKLPAGSFTDDSSMMLCLAASLVDKNGHDPIDQMNRYCAWRDHGYMSTDPSRGCFDIGVTTSRAIARYMFAKMRNERSSPDQQEPMQDYYGLDDEYSSGNGGIMRLAPIPVFYFTDVEKTVEYSMLSSKTTHASPEALDCAALMGRIMHSLLNGRTKEESLGDVKTAVDGLKTAKVKDIANGTYKIKTRDDILTTGYSVHSLEAAFWAFNKTDSYEEGVLLLADMGGDVDTVCCIFGQIAGSHYGFSNIPKRWVDVLQQIDTVVSTCVSLVDKVFPVEGMLMNRPRI